MRRWVLLVLFEIALPLGAMGARTASATIGVHGCFDYHTNTVHYATKFIDSPGTLIGTPGDDVLVGSTGTDVIKRLGGNDIICGADTSLGAVLTLDTIAGRARGVSGKRSEVDRKLV